MKIEARHLVSRCAGGRKVVTKLARLAVETEVAATSMRTLPGPVSNAATGVRLVRV